MYLSLAYQDSVNFPDNKDYESIDLLSSGVKKVSLDNYPNLLRIRISKCYNLKSVTLTNMPKLQVVDLLDNGNLCDVTFDQCPSLVTVDAGFNKSLTKIKGISHIQYLSVPFSHQLQLESLPNAVFLDLSAISKVDVNQILRDSPNLECLICSSSTKLNLSDITNHKSLSILQISSCRLNCDSISDQSNLKIIIFDFCQDYRQCITGDAKLLDNFYVTDPNSSNQAGKDVSKFIDFNPKYQSLQRLLYGPWGVPEIDLTETIEIDHPIVQPPEGTDLQKAADAIVGSIMASAVLDMIGVGVEFINDCMAKPLLLGKANITWSHPRCNRHNERFVRGTPTDDTSQNILIMRTIVESNLQEGMSQDILSDDDDDEGSSSSCLSNAFTYKKVKIDPCLFGENLVEWIQNGHAEHKHPGGLGCGATTFAVVNHRKYHSDPIFASRDVWIKGGKRVAPNGSVMRIASSGCFAFWDDEIVATQAAKYARVTHADPRCVYSSVAAALLIARYIRWNSGIGGNEEPNIDEVLQFAKKFVKDIDQYEGDVSYYSNCKTVEDLKLSEVKKIGYCLKAFGSAVWALRYCNSIEEGIQKVMREGGDSDTNGAVVGALLGAKFGFKGIPAEYIDMMFVGQWMFREMKPFMNLMGIEMPPSPYI